MAKEPDNDIAGRIYDVQNTFVQLLTISRSIPNIVILAIGRIIAPARM